MTNSRVLEGEGEVFDGETGLGRADYMLFDTSTARGKSASGTLDFHDGGPRVIPTRPLTIKPDNGASFQVVITRMVNDRIDVSSHGQVPGL